MSIQLIGSEARSARNVKFHVNPKMSEKICHHQPCSQRITDNEGYYSLFGDTVFIHDRCADAYEESIRQQQQELGGIAIEKERVSENPMSNNTKILDAPHGVWLIAAISGCGFFSFYAGSFI